MKGLLHFSMNRISAMVIIIAILFGGGLYSASSLKVENIPDISFPLVMVMTNYPAAPQDVMDEVTEPIEEKLENMADLDAISSTSSDNVSTVMVQFEQGVDVDKKKQEIQDLLQDVSLPEAASEPEAMTFGFASIPAYYLTVYAGEGMSQKQLDDLYSNVIEPGLTSVDDMDHLDSIGVQDTSLDIKLDADALTAFGLSPSSVTQVIQSALLDGAIGQVEFDGKEQMARVSGDLDSLYILENLALTSAQGQKLTLSDVADIQAIKESEFIARMDGKPAIGVNLYKTSEGNAVDFSSAIKEKIAQWEQQYPNLTFKTTYDSADEVKKSIYGLLKEGAMGIVLAAIMILLFLRNVRMTAIVLVSIPLSILITLILMHSMNVTLNIMSLGGIFIAVGRIVDDSIVVIENIYTQLEKAQEKGESVIVLAVKQVAMAITSSTLVTAAVFLPLALVGGIVGEMFRPFGLAVSSALLASLVVALTVIPMMAKLMVLKGKKKAEHKEHTDGKTTLFYEKVLTWTLNHKIKTLLITFVLFIVTIGGASPFLIVNFMDMGEEPKQMNFSIKLPYETSFVSTDLQAQQLEELLRGSKDTNGDPLFTFIETLVGYNGDDERTSYAAEIITEVNENADPAAVKEQFEPLILSMLPKGSEITISSLSGGGGGMTTTDFSYVLRGDDQEALEQAAEIVKAKLQEFPELKDIEDSLSDAKTEIQIHVDNVKANQFGLTAASIRSAAAAWISKQELGDIRLDNVLYTTSVELDPADKNSIEQLGRMPLTSATGETVYLNEVAKLEEVEAPASLTREDGYQIVKVDAAIDSKNKAAISAQIALALQDLELPEGVSPQVAGVTEQIQESFTQLFVAMAVAVAIVYLIMVLCFGNAGTPFAILFSLPLAVIGGILGLVITRESLNVTSMIGFLMLIGIVITNAIVLLDRAQQLRHEGHDVRFATVEAGKVRLRPIIMTAGATIAAMLPLALGLSEGTLISKGLAVVVIGGLTTSTILTLVVVPVIYEMLERVKDRFSRRSHRKPDAAGETGIEL